MADMLGAIVVMGIVFGLAALILFIVDRRTLRKHPSEEERKEILASILKVGRNWIHFYVGMAFCSCIHPRVQHWWGRIPQTAGWIFCLSSDRSFGVSF